MSKARKDWRVGLRGELTLTMEVDVNGERLACCMTVHDHYAMPSSLMPFRFVEAEMRRKLMRVVEDKLLGPREP